MKSQPSKPLKSNPPPLSRFQLASQSIAQNIQSSYHSKYQPPQYCQSCSKLGDSSVTFHPRLSPTPSTAKLLKSRVLNIRVDPFSNGFSGIIETQNLRLIQLNEKLQRQREEVIETVAKLVSQIKVSVENYDSNRSIVGLESILRVVSGNKIVSYLEDDREEMKGYNNKLKFEILEKSVETVKRIIEKSNSTCFPLTQKTLREKYYLSLEDLDADVNNLESRAQDQSNLMEVFKARLNEFIDEVVSDGVGQNMGVLEQEFQKLRLFINILKEKIEEGENRSRLKNPFTIHRYQLLIDGNQRKQDGGQGERQERMNGDGEDGEDGEENKNQRLYSMLLSQCLVIQQFLNQQLIQQ